MWVNNVGASIARQGDWYTPSEIDAHYAVNFKSVVMGSQAAIPFLEKQGGVIINVSSWLPVVRPPGGRRSTGR